MNLIAIKDLLAKSCPRTLFHYTTQVGMIGIFSEGEIWATLSHFLNDASELLHAKEVAKQVVEGLITNTRDSQELTLLEHMLEAIPLAGINIAVSSFSEKGDSLSQWRGYSGNGTGFAIGFDSSQLRDIVEKSEYVLAPCVYDDAKQFDLMKRIVEECLVKNKELKAAKTYDEENRGGDFQHYLQQYGLIFKNKSFEEEAEWRLISKPISYSHKQMTFRPGRTTIIPYDRVKLRGADNKLPISSIVVGPTPVPKLAQQAAIGICYRYDSRLVAPNIGNSVIPFRNL